MKITLFACESQPIVVEGLLRVLEQAPDLELLGVAADPAEAISQTAELRPRIVLVEQSASLRTTLEMLTKLTAAAPESSPVLWVSSVSESESFRLLQMGARGILKKTLPVPRVLECIRAVANGNVWLENSVSSQVMGFLNRRSLPRLTRREQEILNLVCRGYKNREIGDALNITTGTVKVHLMHIFEKTGVKDRFELALEARKVLGLDPAEWNGTAVHAEPTENHLA